LVSLFIEGMASISEDAIYSLWALAEQFAFSSQFARAISSLEGNFRTNIQQKIKNYTLFIFLCLYCCKIPSITNRCKNSNIFNEKNFSASIDLFVTLHWFLLTYI